MDAGEKVFKCRESYSTACATRRGRAVSYVRLDRGHESTQKQKIDAVSMTEADVTVFKACVCSLHVNINYMQHVEASTT